MSDSAARWQRFRSWLHDWNGRDNTPMSIEDWHERERKRPESVDASFRLLGGYLNELDDPTLLQALVNIDHYCRRSES